MKRVAVRVVLFAGALMAQITHQFPSHTLTIINPNVDQSVFAAFRQKICC